MADSGKSKSKRFAGFNPLFIFFRVVTFLVFVSYIFWLAYQHRYWQGWIFGGSLLVVSLVAFSIFADKPDLLKERFHPGPGTKWWDRIFYAVYAPAFSAVVIVGILDTAYYHWSQALPPLAYAFGLVIYTAGNFITLWAMAVNRFFSSTVRIQTDRGQTVVSTGPYRIVRHPGYVGAILLVLGMALVLGSRWALLPAGVVTLSVLVRTYLEDNTLKAELEGYADYAQKVKSRLLPRVW